MNKNEFIAYDLRHSIAYLHARELKLKFNLQSSPMKDVVRQLDSNKFRQQIVHIMESPHFLFKDILFKLQSFRYANTRNSEESSRSKSLPVLYTPSVGSSQIFSPLIRKEEQWFESLHEGARKFETVTRHSLMTSSKVYLLYQEFIPVTKTNRDTLSYF